MLIEQKPAQLSPHGLSRMGLSFRVGLPAQAGPVPLSGTARMVRDRPPGKPGIRLPFPRGSRKEAGGAGGGAAFRPGQACGDGG